MADRTVALVRARVEGTDVVVTLTPQEAEEVAVLLRSSQPDPAGWQRELARSLTDLVSRTAPPLGGRRRRPLRTPLSAVASGTIPRQWPPTVVEPSPSLAGRGSDAQAATSHPGPPPVTGAARRAARVARTRQPVRRPTAKPATPAPGGLRDAMARLADALSLTAAAQDVPAASARRKPSTADERASALRDILESAARSSEHVPAQV